MARAKGPTPDGQAIIKMVEGNGKRYEALAWITLVITRKAESDEAIDLEKAFDESKKGKNAFYDQLRVALGVFEEGERGGRFVPTEASAEFFSNHTKRTNFASMLKKCAQAAAGLIDMNAEVVMDNRKGTLVISGSAVARQFGKSKVTLDERWQEGLTQKPSFTAIGAVAAEKRGKVAMRGSNTRGVRAVVSSDSDLEHHCRMLIQSLERCRGKPSRRQVSALRPVKLAIERIIS